ncbi:hypothetical protein GPECTOR_16g559 [Gonium pectorale]|uniref:S-acyltransferase n=1 Tax=Gonium pectorale TaxID=33097 RepID=A0A150GKK5_GONPE|nr:hypothetical protein GPECTOR_16g559 [Gonium pectorale]|eukprot:KXZ50386.1 hypothetical protein GPECTOR_16g559 [Gonium pectorale]
MFCGWCGAISEAAPPGSPDARPHPHRRRGGAWRACMRLLSRMSYGVVLFVLGLIGSIILPGVGFVLPAVCRTPLSWLVHTAITYFLSAGVLFNYLAAVATSPGTPVECCEVLPLAFGGAAGAVDGGAENGGGGGTSGAQRGAPQAVDDAQDGPASLGRADDHAGGTGPSGDNGTGGSGDSVGVGGGRQGDGAGGEGGEGSGDGGGPAAGRSGSRSGPVGAAGIGPPPSQRSSLVRQYGYSHLRYCWPCRGPQSADARHCYMCGLCVVDQDHHCPFIANCVGRANLRNFLSFLAFTLLAVVYSAIMSTTHLVSEAPHIRQAARAAGRAAAEVSASRRRMAEEGAAAGGGAGGEGGGWVDRAAAASDSFGAYLAALLDVLPLSVTGFI